MFSEQYSYRIAAFLTFRLLTNGGSIWCKNTNDIKTYVYESRTCMLKGNKTCPPEYVLPDDIAEALRHSLSAGEKTEASIHPLIWVHYLDRYISRLNECRKNKGHCFDNWLTNCPWCEMDRRYKDLEKNKRKISEYSVARRKIKVR